MKAQPKSKGYTVNSFLQKWFISISLLSYGMGIGLICYWVARQYPYNHNLSGFLLISVETVLVPMLFFLLAFILSKATNIQGKLFEAALLSTAGIELLSVLQQLSNLSILRLHILQNGYWQSVGYELGLNCFAIIVYIILLLKFRRQKV